jgi:hypothetical protein
VGILARKVKLRIWRRDSGRAPDQAGLDGKIGASQNHCALEAKARTALDRVAASKRQKIVMQIVKDRTEVMRNNKSEMRWENVTPSRGSSEQSKPKTTLVCLIMR